MKSDEGEMEASTYERGGQWYVSVGAGASWQETSVTESFSQALLDSVYSVLGQELVVGRDPLTLLSLWASRPSLKSTVDNPLEESVNWSRSVNYQLPLSV